ncbi:hypothetical protein H5410_015316 [Solanum commersonii]|uniref:NB-ARC domain-containing protein n=1 Tax=Solanum commersonii TaxID=4109 RepID=A0A9J5ZU21_SOLCO|nr:hypothetical protein H5410_015316 [Solanum commersonii]
MEFLLIFLTNIPKHLFHRYKLNDMLAHVRVLTRKISILVSSENNINEMDGDTRQIFLKAPKSSQLCFPMDDGFLFMNLLLRRISDLLISNVYLVSLIKKIGMVKESLKFLRLSFGKFRKTLDDTSGVVKDYRVHALNVAYEVEHVIISIFSIDKSLLHVIFSLLSITDKIKLIVKDVTNLHLDDKNRDDPLDAKSSDKPINTSHQEAWIIDQLRDEHESKLDVISIVRMLGLDKTTLVKKCIARDSSASYCLAKNESEADLAKKLRGPLYYKRYLIILDNMWDIAIGVMLIEFFPRVKRGNRSILTSRSSKLKIQHKLDSIISANNNLQMMKILKEKMNSISKLMQLWMAEGLVDDDIQSKSSFEEAT